MKTSPRQTSLFTEEQSTSSQEDSLANPTPQQGSDLGRMTNAIYSQKCLEQFEKLSHVGLWAKTFAALLIGMEGWYSTRCNLSWKLKGTKSNRFYFQLLASTPRTKETGSGLLLTPTTREEVVNLDTFQKRMDKYPNGTKMPNLATQVSQMLPTPTAMEYKDSQLTPEQAKKLDKGGRILRRLGTMGYWKMGNLPD